MAKGLLGSGSKGRLSGGNKKLSNLSTPAQEVRDAPPWQDASRAEAAQRAGEAGSMLHKALAKSRTAGSLLRRR